MSFISVRLLCSGHGLPWESLIALVGADPGCLPRVTGRDRITAIRVSPLPCPAASILKQCMLSGGADALVHREVLTCRVQSSTAVVYGTPTALLRGCFSLDGQPFGLGDVAGAIRKAIAVNPGQKSLMVNGRELVFQKTPLIMGILNTTPDSFSDGGSYSSPADAASQAIRMEKAGASIIDIGGESTRPGSAAVSAEEQILRVVPVIRAIREQSSVPVSIDTCIPEVAAAALEAGAGMINSVNGMETPGMAELAADCRVPVAVMHMKGIPATMQNDPRYTDRDATGEIGHYLLQQVEFLVKSGLPRELILVDPGIGFGKKLADNIALMGSLKWIGSLTGCRVLLGHSRKSFLQELTGIQAPCFRDSVTHIVTVLSRGADMVRVHDVEGTVAALKVAEVLGRVT